MIFKEKKRWKPQRMHFWAENCEEKSEKWRESTSYIGVGALLRAFGPKGEEKDRETNNRGQGLSSREEIWKKPAFSRN